MFFKDTVHLRKMIFKLNDNINGLKTIVAGIATQCSAANDKKYCCFYKKNCHIYSRLNLELFYQITQIPAQITKNMSIYVFALVNHTALKIELFY